MAFVDDIGKKNSSSAGQFVRDIVANDIRRDSACQACTQVSGRGQIWMNIGLDNEQHKHTHSILAVDPSRNYCRTFMGY